MKDDCRCTNSYYAKKTHLKLDSETTNQATYKAHPLQKPTQLPPPKVTQKHYDPEVLKTSYKNTFTKPPPTQSQSQPIDSLALHMQHKPKNIPFYSQTSYKQSFPRHEVKQQKQPVYEYKPNKNKFEGQSSYKKEFGMKNNPDLQSSQPIQSVQDYMGKKVKVPFEGRTSYQDTFTKFDVKPEKQPQYRYQPRGTKFQGQSSYKETFTQFPKSAYGNGTQYCPVHPDKVAIK